MEVSLTAGEKGSFVVVVVGFEEVCVSKTGKERGRKRSFSSLSPPLSSLLLTLRERNVDQQLLVRVGLEEQARVLAVALRCCFGGFSVSSFVERVEVEEEGAMVEAIIDQFCSPPFFSLSSFF